MRGAYHNMNYSKIILRINRENALSIIKKKACHINFFQQVFCQVLAVSNDVISGAEKMS